jgi:transposase
MKEYSEVFVGLDVSKLKISVAVAAGGRSGEVRFFGDIDASPVVVGSMVKKLAKPWVKLHFLLRSWTDGIRTLPSDRRAGSSLRVGGPLLDPQTPRGSGQNQPPGCLELGQAAPSR